MNDENNAELMRKYMICFQTGKRKNQWVPIFIPVEIKPAIRFLINPLVRSSLGIPAENKFLFARTTATRNRHLVSTIFAAKDVPIVVRNRFYEHMGLSEAINRDVYQCPSVGLLLTAGKQLDSIDQSFDISSFSGTEETSKLERTESCEPDLTSEVIEKIKISKYCWPAS